MTGVPNYKNPAFWKYGYQTLVATAAILGALAGRTPASQIPIALSRVDSQVESNTQVATQISKSPGITSSPTKRQKRRHRSSGAYYTSGTSYLDDSWRLEYESNR